VQAQKLVEAQLAAAAQGLSAAEYPRSVEDQWAKVKSGMVTLASEMCRQALGELRKPKEQIVEN
jgi:hypothetical protein